MIKSSKYFEDVLSCPFCGKIPTVEIVDRNEDYVVCKTPLCAIEGEYIPTTEIWNKRYNNLTLEQFIDKLYQCGWKSTGDAQWTNIEKFYKELIK